MVYSVDEKETLENLNQELKNVREIFKQCRKGVGEDKVMYYVVGNKIDDAYGNRVLTKEEGEQWVKNFKEGEDEPIDITLMETSAMEGTNVDALFDQIA